MSSPLADAPQTGTSARLIKLHQKYSHSHRISVLATSLARTLSVLQQQPRCIDIGCGDMQIAEAITQALPGSAWRCLDVYPLPAELSQEPRWAKYMQIDGALLPFEDQSQDVALFCDVLHHMPDLLPVQMMKEAGRVARHVVIKDHFEYGLWSRTWLRAMDFVGNWAYGVSVPRRYFDQAGFEKAVADAGLRIESMRIGVDLYSHLPLVRNVLRKHWQFIAVLSR